MLWSISFSGVKTRVRKIKDEFGAETIVLSPIFKQANGTQTLKSYGYNVVDFMEIDPILGELADFRALVNSLQENGKISRSVYGLEAM